jgi:hypothetical protein
MQCEKCSSDMARKTLFRSSGCLVAVGVALLMASLAAIGLGVAVGLVGPRATREAASASQSGAQAKALAALEAIPNLPEGLAGELKATGTVSEESLQRIPLEDRQRVRRALIDYHGSRAATGVAHGVTAGVGTVFILVLLAFGIPGLVVGLLLLRRRKVWRCVTCGFAFERT